MRDNELVPGMPSYLICTSLEYHNAFEAGRQAFKRGELGVPPFAADSKYYAPWLNGWEHEQLLE